MDKKTIEEAARFTDHWHCHLCGLQLMKHENCGALEAMEVFFSPEIPKRPAANFIQFHVRCIKKESYH